MRRVAIIHEWLVNYAGSERVLAEILQLFPQADLYLLVDFLPQGERDFLGDRAIYSSFVQHLPFAAKSFRRYLPLMPLAVEQFDLSGYDLIISSSHAVAKGVITGPDQLHISYIHSPMRYAWDLQHQYLREAKLERGLKSWLTRWLLHRLRQWDRYSVVGVDCLVANSHFIRRRIAKVYGRDAQVIYPPVDVEGFQPSDRPRENFYLTAARFVPYKKVDLIVSAFAQMPDRPLVVVGEGESAARLQQLATPNIQFLPYQPPAQLKALMQRCRAFVFAAIEDFGITLVEAQACGTPVIALGQGGAKETVTPTTGVLFARQDVSSLIEAVEGFEQLAFDPQVIRGHALQFSTQVFRRQFENLVECQWQAFAAQL